jgi:hypothetical protein
MAKTYETRPKFDKEATVVSKMVQKERKGRVEFAREKENIHERNMRAYLIESSICPNKNRNGYRERT